MFAFLFAFSRGSVDVLAHPTICRLWRSELISQSPLCPDPGPKFQIGDKAIESFPWQLTSSVKLDRRHDWIFLGFFVCFEFTGDSFEYIFFADILRGFCLPYLKSLPVEGQMNFSAFVANKAHEVAYFLLLGVFAGRGGGEGALKVNSKCS